MTMGVIGGLADAEQGNDVHQIHMQARGPGKAHAALALVRFQGAIGDIVDQAAVTVLGHAHADMPAQAVIHQGQILGRKTIHRETPHQGEAAPSGQIFAKGPQPHEQRGQGKIIRADLGQGKAAILDGSQSLGQFADVFVLEMVFPGPVRREIGAMPGAGVGHRPIGLIVHALFLPQPYAGLAPRSKIR